MDDAFIRLDFQPVVMDFILCMYISSPSGVWGRAPAANDFSAFWTKVEAPGAIILSTVCSWMTDGTLPLIGYMGKQIMNQFIYYLNS